MKFILATLTILLLLLIASGATRGQDGHRDSGATASGRITFTGNGSEFIVRIDSITIGSTPVTDVEVPAGTHVFTFIPSGRTWSDLAVIETLTVLPGMSMEHTVVPRRFFGLTSEPAGAEVFVEDSLVGTTPLFLHPLMQSGILSISRSGFEPVIILSDSLTKERHFVLRPAIDFSSSDLGKGALAPAEESMTSVYIATGATVVAGISAAYFKIKADGYYSDYLRTGDRSAIDKVRSHDLIAGISLAVSQVGIGLLTYLLLDK